MSTRIYIGAVALMFAVVCIVASFAPAKGLQGARYSACFVANQAEACQVQPNADLRESSLAVRAVSAAANALFN